MTLPATIPVEQNSYAHTWARAGTGPKTRTMPNWRDNLPSTGAPGINPTGTGAGPTIGPLRPKPQAGLNEKPAAKPDAMNGMLGMFVNMMMGGRVPKSMLPGAKAAPAPQAGLRDNSAPARAGRASALFEMGAGLMD